jgi:hypothetical protein
MQSTSQSRQNECPVIIKYQGDIYIIAGLFPDQKPKLIISQNISGAKGQESQ